ncbi:hypothetical protein MAR_003454, partial [Mya arenaria]
MEKAFSLTDSVDKNRRFVFSSQDQLAQESEAEYWDDEVGLSCTSTEDEVGLSDSSSSGDLVGLSSSSSSEVLMNCSDGVDPEHFNSFSKCTICTSLERHMTKILNPDTRAHFRKLKLEHHERQMLERSYYYKKREASRKEPTKYMSIIIDGMDQSKTNLPHFTGRLPKSLSAADLLKTHITGAICHGHGGMYSFLDINQFPHDPNLTIDVILRILEKTVTTNVHLSFLPVGHTHEDIDSKFASIADSLRTKNVESVGSLLKVLEKPEEIRSLFDVRGWITPYLNKIVQITNPLYFKIKRIEDTVKGYYKGNHNDVWKILPQNLLNTLPNSKPSEVIPSFDKINIENHEKLVSSNQFMFSQDSSIADWQNFNETIKQKKYKSSPKWILPNLPRQSDLQETSPIVVPEQISSLMEKEKRQLNNIMATGYRRRYEYPIGNFEETDTDTEYSDCDDFVCSDSGR